MREAVYLAMTGVVSSFEEALSMDDVMRSAVVIIAKELEHNRYRALARELGGEGVSR